jgi:hypothetical protein
MLTFKDIAQQDQQAGSWWVWRGPCGGRPSQFNQAQHDVVVRGSAPVEDEVDSALHDRLRRTNDQVTASL